MFIHVCLFMYSAKTSLNHLYASITWRIVCKEDIRMPIDSLLVAQNCNETSGG